MKHLMLAALLFSTFPVSVLADDVLGVPNVELEDEGCLSVVCKNTIEPETVAKAGEFPDREGNETLSALGSVLFAAGEMGLAENLQTEDPELSATR
ncbi:hypothetical protein M0357_000999 [Vibrio harveyi]|uniref:hypothetical protein n=1 Tax=Vibrio harveyi TaxID=669 RepID=UPI0018F1FFC3|nr:hypothetical protein [Vibrio harveyi]EKO3845915.1 hypothetical protein [Vibrio harveyi]EKO3869617.1 hypothetical protein [Vibrio harveyi]MDF6013360.1 hypothetical protein [Vibrio harveyi]HDM8194439.1 hypothetical protein [Vibrio harveyi]